MIKSEYKNIKIDGLACCVPKNKSRTEEFNDKFGADKIEKLIKMTGVIEKRNSVEKQTASDLAYVAADKLLSSRGVDRSKIGALIFVTETPDYVSPSSAFVLQYRLGLEHECICFDINLGCSGFVSGFNTLAALMTTSSIEYGLLLFGDTMTKKLSPDDRSIYLLLGDAGGALLLKKEETASTIKCVGQSDGDKYNLAIIPAGGFRNPNANPERVLADDGNVRGPYDFYMDGGNIFFYSTSNVVKLLREYLDEEHTTPDDYDALVLHQANEYILKNFSKKSKFPMEKVPESIQYFGNTTGSCIPLTMVTEWGGKEAKSLRLIMCGFGIGLSIGIVDSNIDTDVIMPLIESDDYYTEGV